MHFTGRLTGRLRSWLLVGVLVYVLFFAISSAAPIRDNEIQLASDDELATDPHNPSAPSFRLHDPAVHDASSGGSASHQTPPNFASTASRVQEPQRFQTAFRASSLSLWRRFAVLKRKFARRYYNIWQSNMFSAEFRKWRNQQNAQQKAEARRLSKLGQKSGEMEFKPVFKLAKDESKIYNEHPSAASIARLMQEQEQARKISEAARLKALEFQAASSPDQETDRLTQESWRHSQPEAPASTATDSRATIKLSRQPSSRFDLALLTSKAKKAAEQGAPVLYDVLHRNPLPTLHKRARD